MGRNRFCDEKLQGAALQDTKLRAARTQMHGRGQVNSDSRSRHAALNQTLNEVWMLWNRDAQVRRTYLNVPHSKNPGYS